MGTQTHTPLSAAWLYDELMQHIEPDLLSSNVSSLDAVHAGESAEERAERLNRYVVAFRIFGECLEELSDVSHDDVVLWGDTMKLIASGSSSSAA